MTMSPAVSDKFIFLANHPGLDFINTKLVARNSRVELLETPQDLLVWMFAGYLITAPDYTYAVQNWLKRPAMTQVLVDALRLRDALEEAVGLFMSGTLDGEPSQAIRTINEYLAVPAVLTRLSSEMGEWRLQHYAAAPEGLVALIAGQAGRLFSELDPRLIKKCRNEKCILYFYDSSKNQSRAWCSMDLCGNRAKAAKHYQKEMPI
jgi:predicted RNA-binding Zn ribbon-like protein